RRGGGARRVCADARQGRATQEARRITASGRIRSMQYKIVSDEEFLRVTVSGRDTDQPPSDVCELIFKESEKRERPRILIEIDQKFPLSPASQHQLVTRLPGIGFNHRHRIALVHKTSEARKSNDFINLVAFNRGVSVRNFHSLHDAETWLQQP